MRLFVGLNITDAIRDALESYTTTLQRELPDKGVKWVRPESWHVTLKFIGESRHAEEIQRALSVVQSPHIAMTFRGVGFFSPKSPRVFWAGIESGPELASLAEIIDKRLRPLGVSKETHEYEEYQPHLTLARVGSGKPQGSPRDRNKMPMWVLRDKVAKLPPPDFGTMTADEFILYRSETLPTGPRYTPLARFPLK